MLSHCILSLCSVLPQSLGEEGRICLDGHWRDSSRGADQRWQSQHSGAHEQRRDNPIWYDGLVCGTRTYQVLSVSPCFWPCISRSCSCLDGWSGPLFLCPFSLVLACLRAISLLVTFSVSSSLSLPVPNCLPSIIPVSSPGGLLSHDLTTCFHQLLIASSLHLPLSLLW